MALFLTDLVLRRQKFTLVDMNLRCEVIYGVRGTAIKLDKQAWHDQLVGCLA